MNMDMSSAMAMPTTASSALPSMMMESMMSTATAAAATSSSSASSMGMGMDMGGMGMSMGGNCKISMLWNWDTVDTCFIASSWHNTSKGMFAGSCIGVICLVILLELIRRGQREYDRFVMSKHQYKSAAVGDNSFVQRSDSTTNSSLENHDKVATIATSTAEAAGHETKSRLLATFSKSASPMHSTTGANNQFTLQLIRSFIYTCQFAVAYFVMLLAMYFNGFIIICILIGAFIGHFLCSWDLLTTGLLPGQRFESRQVHCCA